jgi:flagellar basal body-associated protein FliL
MQPAQVHEPVVGHVHHGSKKKAVLRIVLALVVAALAAVGVYFWQQGKTSDLKSQLDAKTAELAAVVKQAESDTGSQADTDKPDASVSIDAPASSISEELIAGNVDTNRTDGKVMIGAIFKYSLNPSAVWVEYGTSPTKMDKASEKLTGGLGAGDPSAVYATGFDVFINNSQLTPGANYYYRTVATVGGKTLYSGVASFVTVK